MCALGCVVCVCVCVCVCGVCHYAAFDIFLFSRTFLPLCPSIDVRLQSHHLNIWFFVSIFVCCVCVCVCSQTLQVRITDDEEYEKHENFFIVLEEPRMAEERNLRCVYSMCVCRTIRDYEITLLVFRVVLGIHLTFRVQSGFRYSWLCSQP